MLLKAAVFAVMELAKITTLGPLGTQGNTNIAKTS